MYLSSSINSNVMLISFYGICSYSKLCTCIVPMHYWPIQLAQCILNWGQQAWFQCKLYMFRHQAKYQNTPFVILCWNCHVDSLLLSEWYYVNNMFSGSWLWYNYEVTAKHTIRLGRHGSRAQNDALHQLTWFILAYVYYLVWLVDIQEQRVNVKKASIFPLIQEILFKITSLCKLNFVKKECTVMTTTEKSRMLVPCGLTCLC